MQHCLTPTYVCLIFDGEEMASLRSISVKNLRGLRDTNIVELKPINILVGKNSSGKSSFARVFPLIKQSLNSMPRDPLLWWGDWVDFGSYDDAIGKYRRGISDSPKASEFMEFSFGVDVGGGRDDVSQKGKRKAKASSFVYTYNVRKGADEASYLSYCKIALQDSVIELFIDDGSAVSKIKINNTVFYDLEIAGSRGLYFVNDSSGMIPELGLYRSGGGNKPGFIAAHMHEVSKLVGFNGDETDSFQVYSLLGYLIKDGWSFSWGDIKNKLKEFSVISGFSNFSKSVSDEAMLLVVLPEIIKLVSVNIGKIFTEASYIEPLRAAANRYYRRQNLSGTEIDSKGGNVAMYFSSVANMAAFNKWFSRMLGFNVKVIDEVGHVSIKVEMDGSGVETNIADMGFGFSQLLPILAQLWLSKTKASPRGNYEKNERLMVVEQPELHLHPAYQDKLADVFVAAVTDKDRGADIKIIAETHSHHLINKLGTLVAGGYIDKSLIQIIVFEFDSVSLESKIRISNFDEDGVVQNWPHGFFDPEII